MEGEAQITLPLLELDPVACPPLGGFGTSRDDDPDGFRHVPGQPPFLAKERAALEKMEPFLPTTPLPESVEKTFARFYDPEGDGVNDFMLVKRSQLEKNGGSLSRREYRDASFGALRFSADALRRRHTRLGVDGASDQFAPTTRIFGVPLPPRSLGQKELDSDLATEEEPPLRGDLFKEAEAA